MRLKDLRKGRNLKQKDIAKALNIAERTYSEYETESKWIPKDLLIKLANFYNTSTNYILDLTNEIRPHLRISNK